MLGGESEGIRESLRRGAFGIGVVAAHIGFVAVYALSTLMTPAREEPPPLIVSMVEQVVPVHATPVVTQPKLQTMQPVTLVAPEITIPTEPQPAAITVSLRETPPSPQISAPQIATTAEPPSMSEVAYLKQPSPRYPSESRRAREEGLVVLRVLVDESGRVRSVHVHRSSGHPRLDKAACEAVERAVFKPYVEGNSARPAVAMVPVEFSLHS